MKEYIVFLLFVTTSFFWYQLCPLKIKNNAIPWALAIVLLNVSCAAFYTGVAHALLAISNYLAMTIMCDGFGYGKRGRNAVWTSFLVFWVYMVLSAVFGYYIFQGIFFWINVLCISFCCGYYVARWVIRTEGALGRLLFAVVCMAALTMVLYSRHGGLNAITEGAGRANFDAETLGADVVSNENYTALVMLCFMPFLAIALLRTPLCKRDKISRLLALGCMLLCSLVLIRTGSRNAVLGVLPTLGYFMFSTTQRQKRRKRIVLLVLVSILFVPLMLYIMRGAESIRAFDFSNKELEAQASGLERYTTGRLSMWKNQVSKMSTVEMMVGSGMSKTSLTEFGKVNAGNAHSIYMTIFYNSGFIGILLFLVFVAKCWLYGWRMGERGRMALMFIGTWLFTGFSESWGMVGGAIAIIGGFGLGLLTDGAAQNSEFGENQWLYFRR